MTKLRGLRCLSIAIVLAGLVPGAALAVSPLESARQARDQAQAALNGAAPGTVSDARLASMRAEASRSAAELARLLNAELAALAAELSPAVSDTFDSSPSQASPRLLARAQAIQEELSRVQGSPIVSRASSRIIGNGGCPTINGTLGSGSPDWPSVSGTQTGRLNRNGISSTCAAPKACLQFDGTPGRAFDAYTFTNFTAGVLCINVNLTVLTQAAANYQSNAYLGSYNPANLCGNYLADPGLSSGSPPTPTNFSFEVPAGQDFIIVVHTTNPGEIGGQYQLTVSDGCVPPVPPAADMATTIIEDTDPVVSTGGQTYTVGVQNLGPDSATNVAVAVRLPMRQLLGFSIPGGWGLSGPDRGGRMTLTNAGPVPVGTSTFQFFTTAPCSALVTTTHMATASASSAAVDANPFNNASSAVTTVTPGPCF